MTDPSLGQYTILYALTRDVRLEDGPPQHRCYHHLARVTATSLECAIARCRVDSIRGFDFQLLIAVAGEPELLAVGGACLAHSFVAEDDDA